MVPAGDVQAATFADIPLTEAPAWTAIGVPGLYRLGMLASWRAIADLSPGKRVAMTPASIWWKIFPISGGTKKAGGGWSGSPARSPRTRRARHHAGGHRRAGAVRVNRIREVLELFGATMENVVEITSFHKDPRAWEIVMDVGRDYFDVDRAGRPGPRWAPPASGTRATCTRSTRSPLSEAAGTGESEGRVKFLAYEHKATLSSRLMFICKT